MNQRARFSRSDLLLSMILIVFLVVISGGMGVYVLSDPGIRHAVHMVRAAMEIEQNWVDIPPREAMNRAARSRLFSLLDPYSGYVDLSAFDRMREELTGQYGGIGVTVIRQEEGLQIMSVRENGPAGKSGLLPGDVILAADSLALRDVSTLEASGLLRGEPGTTVRVTVFRPVTRDTTRIDLRREYIPIVHVTYAGYTDEDVVYIRLLDFDAGATEQLRAALDSLVGSRDAPPRGIVLDLRDNPGGLFDEGYRVASLFLPQGTFIVGTDARSRWKEETHYALHGDMTGGLPMAVVVNEGSASAAEIVAGALQQSQRAVLVGDTTFGKGLVQGFVTFPGGDGLRLSISRYYFANDVYLTQIDSAGKITGQGLAPDYHLAGPERDPFVRSLENALLLQQFAYEHVDEILGMSDPDDRSRLLSRFREFLEKQEFAFKSPRTAEAQELARRLDAHGVSDGLAARLVAKSRTIDRDRVFEYDDYIILRLRQIAYEHEYGTYRTYRDVIVPGRADIQFAIDLLTRQP